MLLHVPHTLLYFPTSYFIFVLSSSTVNVIVSLGLLATDD